MPRINKRSFLYVITTLLITIFFSESVVLAQPTYYRSHYITTDDGLSHSEVTSLFKDSRGFMWIGTRQGLNKFDGNTIEVYKPTERMTQKAGFDLVGKVSEDKNGTLWANLLTGIYTFDRKENVFKNFLVEIGKDSVLRKVIDLGNVLDFDDDGNVWFGGNSGLNQYDFNTKKLNPYLYRPKDFSESELYTNRIKKILVAHKDSIWLATNNGLKLFNPKTNTLKTYIPELVNVTGLFLVNGIELDSKGNYYISTLDYGIWTLSEDKTRLTQFIDVNQVKAVQSLHIDKWDRMWIGGQERLYIYDLRSDNFIDPQALNIGKNEINQTYATLYSDDDGIVWLGSTGRGVIMLDPFTNPFKGYLQEEISRSKLSNQKVACFHDTGKGIVYIGTDGGGLYIWNERNDTFDVITKSNSQLNDNVILDIVPWKNNTLLLATYQGGLNVYDINSRTFKAYTTDPQNPNAIEDNFVLSVLVDENEAVWVATNERGLFRFHEEDERFEHIDMGVEWGTMSLLLDKNGYLWVGSYNGVKVLNRASGEYIHFPGNPEMPHSMSHVFVSDIIESSEGSLFFTTLGGGINVFQPEDSTFLVLNEDSGLVNNYVGFGVEDDDGLLWFGTSNGISKYSLATKKFENFRKEEGLPVTQFFKFGSAGYKRKDGSMLFGSFDGFVSFDPSEIKAFDLMPDVSINNIKVFGRKSSTLIKAIYEGFDEVELRYDEGSFEISFDGINYSSLGNTEFRYSMANYFDSWNYINDQRTVRFAKIPDGQYEFVLQASSDGSHWTVPVTINITINKPYWKTWWFYIISIGGLIAVVLGVNYYRTVSIRQSNIRLSKEVDIRTKELLEVNSQLRESSKMIHEQSNEIEAQNEELMSQNEEISSQRDSLEHQTNILKESSKMIHEQSNEIEAQNEELVSQNEEISTQRDNLESQNEVIITQRDNLENQHDILNDAKRKLDSANAKLLEMNETLEVLVEKRTKKLSEVNKDLDRFVYSASHELGAPIKSLKGLLNLVGKDQEYSNRDEYLDMINSSVDKLDIVIKSLREFSRNKSKKVVKKQVEIKKLVKGVFSELRFFDPKVELRNDVDDRALVFTDPARLSIILTNLIGNSIKYSDGKKPDQFVQVTTENLQHKVRISVTDNGEGIEEDQKNKIFKMYFRGSVSSDGSGLGLYLVKEFLKRLNGKISFESTWGEGTVFHINLPLK